MYILMHLKHAAKNKKVKIKKKLYWGQQKMLVW